MNDKTCRTVYTLNSHPSYEISYDPKTQQVRNKVLVNLRESEKAVNMEYQYKGVQVNIDQTINLMCNLCLTYWSY